ncbi:hypothetical protein [Bacillus cereus group sp. BfR-BA-01400]|uniref:hypothetical protein n=1 Tax=Bacillus cereus group sp. BfR-BA-01400 TaxID=2920334 RepID=UPI001F59EB38
MSDLTVRLKDLGVSRWRFIKLNFKTVVHQKTLCHYKETIIKNNVTINFDDVVSVSRFGGYPIEKRLSWIRLAEQVYKDYARYNPPSGHPQYFIKEKFLSYLENIEELQKINPTSFVEDYINKYCRHLSAHYYEGIGYVIHSDGNHRSLLLRLIGAKSVTISEVKIYKKNN